MNEEEKALRPIFDYDIGIFLCPECDFSSHNYSVCRNHIWLEHLEGGGLYDRE